MACFNKEKIILASASPRRKQLLEQLDIEIVVSPADIDETVVSSFDPAPYVEELAELKAEFTAGLYPESWVIGADTIVVADGQILGKPESKKEAAQMLQMLSGREHSVHTGFCLFSKSKDKVITRSVRTEVEFKQLTKEEIFWYIDTNEPFDKAGAYGIQGIGAFLVRGIKGSWSNVVGLPVCEVFETLIDLNIIQLRN